MQVFICFLTAITLLIVSGCSNSTIQMRDDNQLIIFNDKTTVEVRTPAIETTRINMSSVYVN
ncbi:MAG: hypothetical protein V3S80_09835 [Sulfurimonadaceae bacterium]